MADRTDSDDKRKPESTDSREEREQKDPWADLTHAGDESPSDTFRIPRI